MYSGIWKNDKGWELVSFYTFSLLQKWISEGEGRKAIDDKQAKAIIASGMYRGEKIVAIRTIN